MLIFLVGVFVGACGVIGAQLVAGRFEPLHLDVPWRPLPPRLETISRWGAAPLRFRPRRITEIQPDDVELLPTRIPGAALLDVPPVDAPLHTSEYVERPRWVPAWLYERYLDAVNRISVLESDEAFARWWEDTWVDDRKRCHSGRHRRDALCDTNEWRMNWAEYDTQRWPTLSTTGHAWDVEAQMIVICRGSLNGLLTADAHRHLVSA